LIDLEKINDIEQDEEYVEYPVIREEFDKALRDLKLKKAVGIDEIQDELWKEAGKNMVIKLFKLIKDIYRTVDIPTDFVKSIFIPMPKKTSAKNCEKYRTISLISHASYILTKIMYKRMERKIEDILSEEQFGFRKNIGSRGAILDLKLIVKKEYGKISRRLLDLLILKKHSIMLTGK